MSQLLIAPLMSHELTLKAVTNLHACQQSDIYVASPLILLSYLISSYLRKVTWEVFYSMPENCVHSLRIQYGSDVAYHSILSCTLLV